MKNLSFLLLIVVMFSSCKNETLPQRDGYLITGNSPGIYNGIRAYLKAPGQKGREILIDTAIVMNETFVFDGKLKSPDLVYLAIDNIKGKLPLILANDNITIDVDKSDVTKSSIIGATSTDLFNSFNEGFLVKRKELQQISNDIRKAGYSKDTSTVKNLQEKLKSLNEGVSNHLYDFVDNNSDNVVALILLDQQSKQKNLDGEKFMNSYNKLSENLKSSSKGKLLGTSVNQIIDQLKKTENLKIGKPAPEFSAPDTAGNNVALNDIKGKVTIVDFWASWCGPCRRENPNVVKVYNELPQQRLRDY